jgi:prolyl-tRNA synthetase
MAHGDELGLRLPPRLAPTQVVVVLVRDEGDAPATARGLLADLLGAGHRASLDDRVDVSFGRRAVEWELKGVPVRVEVGPRDLAGGQVTLVRRSDGSKRQVAVGAAVHEVGDELAAAQTGLLAEALQRREAGTAHVRSVDEVAEAARTGFAVVPWAVIGPDGEDRLASSGVTVRCLQGADGSLPESDDEPDLVAICARAY